MSQREAIVEPIKTGDKSDLDNMAHLAAQVGDGRLFKMDVDYASQVDEAIPKADEILKVKLCFDGMKWDLLNETILTLSKKRLIIKIAIAKMVEFLLEQMRMSVARSDYIREVFYNCVSAIVIFYYCV
uniref:ARM repeat superfamily protein n=1 Tax=Heterorhabditis bacteriophora TaxID=37862 RepID=A0A1I7XJ49_HETBA